MCIWLTVSIVYTVTSPTLASLYFAVVFAFTIDYSQFTMCLCTLCTACECIANPCFDRAMSIPVYSRRGRKFDAQKQAMIVQFYTLANKEYRTSKLPSHILLVHIVRIFHLTPLLRLVQDLQTGRLRRLLYIESITLYVYMSTIVR